MSIEFWVGLVVTVAIAGGIWWAMRRKRNHQAPPYEPGAAFDRDRHNGDRTP